MNKIFMFIKTGWLFSAIITGLLMLGACSQNDEDFNDKDKTPDVMTIVATQGGELTRMTHDDDDNHGLIVKWTAGDAFRVYASDDEFETFAIPTPYEGDGKTATFEGSSTTGDYLNAFFPDARAAKSWADCSFNVLGQVQDAEYPRAHLADYNFMTAIVDLSGDEISDVEFTYKIAVLKFMVTLPSDVYPKSITLSTQDDAGIVIVQKASDGTAITKAKHLTMTITGATSNEHTAYMTVLPSALQEQLAVAVTGSDGIVYNYTVTGFSDFSYKAGKVYNATLIYGGTSSGFGKSNEFSDATTAAGDFGGGSGLEQDPYLITNAAELKLLVDVIAGTDYANYNTKYYKLTTDIHVTATYWLPIGGKYVYESSTSKNAFEGHFDGGGHTISGRLSMDPSVPLANFGFFGCVREAVLENLHVAADVTSYDVTFDTNTAIYLGGIAGQLLNSPNSIFNCTVSGDVTGGLMNVGNGVNIGGITGYSGGSVENCLVTGNVTGNRKEGVSWASRTGGVVGIMYGIGASMKGCVMRGNVTGGYSTTSVAVTGGIVGQMMYSSIHTSHNYGNVIAGEATENVYTGELLGIINSGTEGYIYDCCTSIDIAGLDLVGSGVMTTCDGNH